MKRFTPWKLATAAGGVFLSAFMASVPALADAASAAAATDPGIWQKHEYSFAFMGFTSTYSCDGLADKLRVLLLAAGARKDAKAQPGACASGFGRPDKFARAQLTFYTLAADTGGTADGQHAAGSWRPVAFADRSPRELRIGDCELIEQFQHNVLPMFATRNIDSHTTCIPHQDSGSVIDLKFESFAAVPAAAARSP